MLRYLLILVTICLLEPSFSQHCYTNGKQIFSGSGKAIFLKGISLGNWLNPEGYMLHLDKVSSARTINTAFTELLNEKGAHDFWKEFRRDYISDKDFSYIKSAGFNTVRLPFNYRLFVDDQQPDTYLQEGFDLINYAIQQCKLVS